MVTEKIHIDFQKIEKSKLSTIDMNNLPFGKHFSDHMFIADFLNKEWKNFQIIPYGNIPTSPALSAIHYGQSIFEGMKAYKNAKGEVSIFRPLDNFRRLNCSAERMAMEPIPEEIFMDGLTELIKLDSAWVPTLEGSSLYIRPLYFGSDGFIGVHPSANYRLLIFTSPTGYYYTEPVKVKIETKYIRAVEGGVGFVKASGNYGRSLYPTKIAQQEGYHQVIWTDGANHRYLEESGTMNLMFIIDDVLITPSLSDTILAGITRDSILTIARDWKMKVQERKISIDEVLDAHKRGHLQEAFGTGTAAVVAPISLIGFEGKQYQLPPIADTCFQRRVAKELSDIRMGRIADRHNWMHKI